MTVIPPPTSTEDLLTRAEQLAGKTLQQIATQHNIAVPDDTTHAKGWTGKLLELALGANAASRPMPDFTQLGIELKTIPINQNGTPQESTYICAVQLDPKRLTTWEQSLVKHKLTQVLWIPIEASKTLPLTLRHIGNPILWRATPEQEQQLKQDWHELRELITLGELDQITSEMGKYLHIRPKAANARALVQDKNQTGTHNLTLPRGFYLRTAFTKTIISTTTHRDI